MFAFCKDTFVFYSYILKERYVASGCWPERSIDVSGDIREQFITAPYGKKIGCVNGMPAWVDYDDGKLDRESIEKMRLQAYADPINGSDRYFSEASRMASSGEEQSEIDAKISAGVARAAEIATMYPWPEEK